MRNGKTQGTLVGAGLCVLAVIAGAAATAQTLTPDQKSAKEAVVKITARQSQGASTGTGFAWHNSTTVVTAAHVIAGATQITVYSDALKSSASAKVIRVNNVADLAMLHLDRDIGLVPARVTANVLANDEHFIWGYPREVNTVQGDDIRFSRSLEQRPTMKSIFKTEDEFKRSVGDQGFPAYTAEILRVSSIIQHGHSGAPIFDKAGSVVGVADGGLHQGAARINWAISAGRYLQSPDSFKDPPPRGGSSTGSLMSAVVDKPVAIDLTGASGSAGRNSSDRDQENSVLRLSWTASLFEILSTLSEEDKESYSDTVNKIDESVQRTTQIDVYEDYETGATLAVPHGMPLTYDAAQNLLTATSRDRLVQMIVKIVDANSAEAAEEAQSLFFEHLNELGEWQRDPDQEDELEDEDGVAYHFLSRVQRDDDRVTGQLYASLIRDDGGFFGSSLVVEGDPSTLSEQNESLLNILDICILLSDFAKK